MPSHPRSARAAAGTDGLAWGFNRRSSSRPAAVAGRPGAAERRIGVVVERLVVDVHDAGAQPVGDLQAALHASAELATSMSAASSTMSALLPPSSRLTRFSVRPAASPTSRPTAVEPVN